MLKGLALTPPVLGRIAIGRVVERNGKRLPEKDDEFTITTQVQGREGWIPHPVDQELRKTAGEKLRAIPVSMLFDDPDLNLRASYSMFDRRSGRPLCVGNGETCKRATAEGVQSMPCAAPDGCAFGQAGGCKPYARLNVRIGDDDELGTFIFRTTGFNSIRTLSARLSYFHAAAGGRLAGMPLELRLRGKSTTQSHGSPIYFADLTTRPGTTLSDAIGQAKTNAQALEAAGFDRRMLEEVARRGLQRGAFEESSEEGQAIVEEIFPAEDAPYGDRNQTRPGGATLARKLEGKLAQATDTERDAAGGSR